MRVCVKFILSRFYQPSIHPSHIQNFAVEPCIDLCIWQYSNIKLDWRQLKSSNKFSYIWINRIAEHFRTRNRKEKHQAPRMKSVQFWPKWFLNSKNCSTSLVCITIQRRRIWLDWMAFGKLRYTFMGKRNNSLKRKVFEMDVLPVVTYGAKTITIIEASASSTKGQRQNEKWVDPKSKRMLQMLWKEYLH